MYPACDACNAGKSSDEQALSFIVSMMDWGVDDDNSSFQKHLKAVRNNRPEIIAELTALLPTQAKRHVRQIFGNNETAYKFRAKGWGVIKLGPEAKKLLSEMCVYFGQTLFFKHNKSVFRGEVFSARVSCNFVDDPKFNFIISKLNGIPKLVHTSHDISDQFFYRYYATEGGFYAILQFRKPQVFFVICAIDEQYIPHGLIVPEGWYRSGIIGPQVKTTVSE